MKPLTDEQKEKMWKEIGEALRQSSEPRTGEYTLASLRQITGFGRTKLGTKVKKLLKAEILGVRKGSYNGAPCNIYFPVKEISVEEIVSILVG